MEPEAFQSANPATLLDPRLSILDPSEIAVKCDYRDDLGLTYYGARFYMPEIGRFIQVDPAREFANPYSYVGNNPVGFTDPSGLWVKGYSKWWRRSTWDAQIGDPEVTSFFVEADPFDENTVAYFTSQQFVSHDQNASVIAFRPREEHDFMSYWMPYSDDPRYNAEVYVYNETGAYGPFLASTTTRGVRQITQM